MTRPTIALALASLGLSTAQQAQAACDASPDITVCDSGCTTDDLSVATSSAVTGNVICIEGTYTHDGGRVDVYGKSITLQHDGVGTATVARTVNQIQLDIDSGGTLVVSDLVFDGAGGASRGIDVDGTLIASNITVRDHDSGIVGAGLRVNGGTVTCTDCTFDNNDSTGNGGHAYITGGGDLNLVRGVLRDGDAADGGAIYINSGRVDALNTGFDVTHFENNNASSQAGAIFLAASGTMSLDRTWFEGNTAADGAVFYVDGGDNIDITRTVFCNNDSGDDGGAMVFLNSANNHIGGSIFLDNTTDDKGGAIYVYNDGDVDVDNSTFVRNAGASDEGSAIHNRQGSGDARNNVYLNHTNRALEDESANADLVYAFSSFFGNGTDAFDDATASAGNGDIFTDPGFTTTASACLPGQARQPLDSVLVGAGDPNAAWNNPDGSRNTMGAFGGPDAMDLDFDGDGFGALADCDETDDTIFPGAYEVPSDGIDNDCSGSDYVDSDMDGFEDALDCAPYNNQIFPGAAEIAGDGIDQDCNGADLCFVDVDGDGFGTSETFGGSSLDCDLEAGGASIDGDCEDGNALIYPGTYDTPGDGIDQDCDTVDDCFLDGDDDGFGTAVGPGLDLTCADDVGYANVGGDCADGNPDRFPGNPEVVGDGVDQDCDGQEECYQDSDGDGFGRATTVISADFDCADVGEAAVGGDCDDQGPGANLVYPGATENVADEIDSDCDGQELCYFDNDNDGYGAATTTISLDEDCQDNQESTNNLDCGDGDANINPDGTDVPGNTLDEDCNNQLMCWLDQDGDGSFGNTYSGESPNLTCSTGAGFAFDANVDDCDDDDNDRYPANTEDIADGVDQDCDNQELCYVDGDQDGYGDDSGATVSSADLTCSGATQSTNDLDCDDGNNSINPDGTDIAGNGVDEDCNGRLTCWLDNDMDGAFGDQFSGQSGNLNCDTAAGFGFDADVEDCDDGNNDRYPGNPERIADGTDQNCDGLERCYVDADTDAYGSSDVSTSGDWTCTASGFSVNQLDCNDGDGAINPVAIELALDFVDQNCDDRELCAQDADGDGFGSDLQPPILGPVGAIDCVDVGVSPNLLDCDDTPVAGVDINPNGTEAVADGIDQDCNGEEECYLDADDDSYGDDYTVVSSVSIDCLGVSLVDGRPVADRGGDCLDTDANYYPGAAEIPGDGRDQDCSGTDLVECYEDLDFDGFGTPNLVPDPTGTCNAAGFSVVSTDCDDGANDVFPTAVDDCDGIDNDCSEVVNGTPCAGDDDWDGDGICAAIVNNNGTGEPADDIPSEYDLVTDDCAFDSDGDGWGDGEEFADGLDPASDDSDGDGVPDGSEWPRVTDPSDSPKPDLDQDGIPDVLDVDDDDDNVDSVVEGGPEVDSDGDGTPDREDIDDDNDGVLTEDELDEDSDDDGFPNRIDTDDDGDGWDTLIENLLGASYLSPDSDGDSRLDRDEGDWMGQVPVIGTDVDCAQLAVDTDPAHTFREGPEVWYFDFDNDGLHDLVDLDDDGDGQLTQFEGNDDLDGDGCPNSLDLDSDGDGKLDSVEGAFADADKDGISDLFDSDDNDGGLVDSDGDLILTIDESPVKNGTLSLDPDTSCAESYRFENPYAYDTDILTACAGIADSDEAILNDRGDLAIDGLELGGASGYDPIDTDGDGIVDWRDRDDDNDGVPTDREVGFACDAGETASIIQLTIQGTTSAWLQCLDDTTGDTTFFRIALSGPPGMDEVAYVDTDGDGLLDFQDPDDDNDGIPTADEVASGGFGNDNDGDGLVDHLDTWDEDGPTGDGDADGIPRDIEEELGLDPFDDDSDGDGVPDADELGDDWENPRDTDGDGDIDALDEDDDDDGVPTIDELRSDTDGDGDPDYLDRDSDGDGVDDGDEFDLDDDCDGDPDHIDALVNEGLCDQAAFDPGYYERQECSCGTVTSAGWLGWLGVGLGWLVRRR